MIVIFHLIIILFFVGAVFFAFYKILFNKKDRQRDKLYKFCDRMYEEISVLEMQEKDEVKKACYCAIKNRYIDMIDTGDDIMESSKLLQLPDSTLIYIEAELQNDRLKKEFYTDSKIRGLYSEALSDVKKIEEEVKK